MRGIIQGTNGVWEMVIGLEIHAQITSNSKLFSGAATAFGAEPNSQVSLVDAAMPGMLPVINKVCVEQAIRTGLGLKAQVNLHSVFDRKNYFYPDLPQGYQISQFLQPIVGAGTLVLDMEDGTSREIGITRLHLEQDAGKSVHDMHPDRTYVDLNRSGVALMEIVSDPDLRTPGEAGDYLRKMRSILRYLGTCDGNMEQGSMRADVNVSVRRPGDDYGTRCEIKNVNSIRFVEQAIQVEAQRQVDILEDGGAIVQETRLFDPRKLETRSMRSKEEAHDYRYFPDPDLLPLEFEQTWVDSIAASLPELPDDRKARFVEVLGLSTYDAGVLVAEKEVADYFEALATGRDAKAAANWITGDLFGALNKVGRDVTDSPIAVSDLGALIDLIADDTISGRIAKSVFEEMFKTGQAPGKIIEEKGLRQVTDSGAIEAIVDAVMESNHDKVAEYRGGKGKLFGFFVGQVMKQSEGKANPKVVNDLLKNKLGPTNA